MTIPNPIKLAFDPSSNDDLRAIFEDGLARTLWMGWKSSHIVDQHFNREVISFAKLIREIKPKDWREMHELRHWVGPLSNFAGESEQDTWKALAPYLLEGRVLEYVIVQGARPGP